MRAAPLFWEKPPGLLADLLLPIGTAWDIAGRLRRALSHSYRAPVPVLCVGNLVAGGAGKTPVALALSDWLRERGVAVHVVTRGYGGRLRGPLRVDPTRHDALAVGDEALLLALHAPCWVASDRAAGVRAAVAAGARAILLDDGFQNPAVAKTLGLIVVDAAYGFGNGRVIPAGPLRENLRGGLARADAWCSSAPKGMRAPPIWCNPPAACQSFAPRWCRWAESGWPARASWPSPGLGVRRNSFRRCERWVPISSARERFPITTASASRNSKSCVAKPSARARV